MRDLAHALDGEAEFAAELGQVVGASVGRQVAPLEAGSGAGIQLGDAALPQIDDQGGVDAIGERLLVRGVGIGLSLKKRLQRGT